ncbi:MAG: TonB-dependent receptor [Bacteroidales bacterium]|nr:TonB-dependent receptor [Bacteroidales bacterium]
MKRLLLIATMILCTTVLALAQTLRVQGTVLDKGFGEPITGASILEVGTQNGTITDIDGNFELNVQKGAQLQISYIGYTTQTLAAQAKMEVLLSENAEMLEEMVVTGYTTQRKADLTGSVAVVSTKEMKTSSSTDPMRALQGKVAGMTVTTNGSPSGTATIRIRGIGSFNSNQDPLYVIDGVPTTNGLNTLNANDIESMQVLKDAASASIYGSRAANGVIIITTKQGKKDQKIKIDFSASATASFYNGQSKMELCNTEQYATTMAQAALNDGIDPVVYASNYGLNLNAANGFGITAWDPATSSYKNYTVAGLYGNGQYINAKQTMRLSDTDWLDQISRVGMTQNYDLSLSHGSEKGSQMLSIGYKKADGVLKYTDFENIAVRLNSTYNINKYVTAGENLTLTYSDQVDCAPLENALKMSPTVPVFEDDGKTYGGPVGGMSDRQNPMRELYYNRDNRLTMWRIFGNGYINIKPVKGLDLRSNFGIDYNANFIHSMTYTFVSDIVKEETASTRVDQTNDMKWNWSNTANYLVPLPENHTLSVLGGFELYKQNYININGSAEGFAIENKLYMWPNAATGTQHLYGANVGYTLVSFFGKADYNWNDQLLASFTIRRDGSSRFGKNNRYGTFPAASLGYRLSKHIKADWLTDLKLRASWGQTGNQAIDNAARYTIYIADYGTGRQESTAYDFLGAQSGMFESGYRVQSTGNDNLKWETAEQWNAGLDFALFDNSLFGTVDAYIKDVKDMLINPAYLGSVGEGGSSWQNGPSLRNIGMEFTLGYRNKTSFGLGYSVNGNLDFFRNKVTWLPLTTTGSYEHTATQNIVQAKMPYGSMVGYVAEGLFQSKEEVLCSGQENARLGGLKYADLDGNGVINSLDQTWIYNPVPDFSYGLTVNLDYKGFDFQMFWQGVAGVDVYNNQKFQTDFFSLTDPGSNKGNRMLGAWTTDNTHSKIPALTTNNTGDEGRRSSYFVENGSYLKLRTLQLGYTFDQELLEKAHLSNARLYVSGNNLCTIKSKSLTCTDPENPGFAYPIATSISVGLQVGF